ncbi:MAG TPA: hypothetical protein VGR96_11405 [Acidobacteriaceae bacterium]|nr:hypothetical protein [Acidobacteriaceae bacterium]
MQRYLILCLLFLLTVPVGLSIQGCANKNSDYCNGSGYGYLKSQPVAITLQPQATGLSVAFGQLSQLSGPQASTCTGSSASVSSYTYGTTDRTIADVSPTGQVCGGTWNYNTPGVASYTTCLPTNKQGVAYLTASASGFTSNQVAVYSHAPISSLSVAGPTDKTGTPICLSQGQTSQLDATAYTTNSSGQQALMCSPNILPNGNYGPNDCNNVIGHIIYSASNAVVVTINNANGVATAQAPGSSLINGTISNTGATSGYFYTCAPKSISLSVSNTGATSAKITPNNPQPLTATVTDVNNNVINGLQLNYVSTNPGSIDVSNSGSVTASFPSSSAITAICAPNTCNPAPINVIGVLGTGAPVVSNLVQVTSPGQNSTYIWAASPNSPYFVPTDLFTGQVGNPIKLPYQPNSMVLDQKGTTLYFGSYRELMVYSATSNSLTTEVTGVPGVVLGVSPDNSTVVINDQERGTLYLYYPGSPTGGTTGGTATSSASSITSFGGIGQRAMFSPDGQTVYIVGKNVLYVHNTYTGWSVENLPAAQASATTGACPVNNASSLPNNPNVYPPDTPSNPNNSYNSFCSPDVAVTVPSSGVFLSGSQTSAYGICPNTTVNPVQLYPEAATVNVGTDHVAATTDGKHIIGATASPATLTDISVNVPIGACPTVNGQTTGNTFTPAPSFTQTPLASYGITNINEVIASTNSLDVFITYLSNATTPPAGGALLPVYEPSSQPGVPGTLTNVKLQGNAIDPVSGIFSPDNTIFFVSTTGDDQLHLINTSTMTDVQQVNPKLVDANGNPVAPIFLAVKPRPTT